jgi:FK506-binding protein 14
MLHIPTFVLACAIASSIVCADNMHNAQPRYSQKVIEVPPDCGAKRKSKNGDTLQFHQIMRIHELSLTGEKGLEVDNTYNGEIYNMHLGAGQGIKCWDLGLTDMCVGEKRELVCPPGVALGPRGRDQVPPGATLGIIVELVNIKDGPEGGLGQDNIFADMDRSPKDNLLTVDELMAWFADKGQPGIPDGLMENEDRDKDGIISWEEFSGPKGERPGSQTGELGEVKSEL